ncbi:transposase [Streptomyces microflavus]|uniref:transposase n=1 Tax=Streptomyces microflavus TaxID=1919 RepID=UPI001E334E3B|nr:transposase [Streptomyces microflavus]
MIRTPQLLRFLSDTPLRRRIVRRQVGPEDLAHISPYLTEHVNRFGEFSTHKLGIHPAAYGPKADLAGEPAPTGPARPGAMPPSFPDAAIDDPALPELPAEPAAAQADEMDADPVNRELSIARKAIGWWHRQGWIECDPTIGMDRRRTGRRGAVASSAMTHDAPRTTPRPRCCLPGPAMPPSAPWSGTPARHRLGRPACGRTRPRSTPPHVNPGGSGLQDHPVPH